MSREIKFRVWSKEDRKYRTDCNLTGLFNSVTGTPATIYSDEGDRFDIEQYTGFKDKNGKKIYEGDLLQWDLFDGRKPACIMKVRWNQDEGCFEIHFIRGNFGDSMLNQDDCSKGYEVIGNIHENPELLGGENELAG